MPEVMTDNLCFFQRTLMHEAASSGNVDTMRYLCDKGVDVNVEDDRWVSEWDCC